MHNIQKWLEKLPLILVIYSSAVLIAISTYNTFPITNEMLRMGSAIVGGLSFDLVLTSTVFAKHKNIWSYITIMVAFILGLAIALDLYLAWHLAFLHAFYIALGVTYSLHLATNDYESIYATKEALEKIAPLDINNNATPKGKRNVQKKRKATRDSDTNYSSDSDSATNNDSTRVDAIHNSADTDTSDSGYICPSCHVSLKNKQALASARKLGYCAHCKN